MALTPDISLTDVQDQPEISLQDTGAPPIPSQPVVDNRAAKVDYGLQMDSPGKPTIVNTIQSGNEQQLRQQVAFNEDQKYKDAKDQLVQNIVQGQGGNLSPEDTAQVLDLHSATIKTDPDTILEKVFSDRYVQDILGLGGDKTNDPAVANAVPDEANVAAGMLTRSEWLKTQYENKQAEWQSTGWLPATWQYAVEMVPFLPWWRQAQALDRPSHLDMLPGQTIRDNISYMYSLPLPEMQQKYKQAMDYFAKSGNTLDGLQFAQAMVSYSTSDEYLSNAMGVADYTTAGLPVIKALLRGGKVAEVAAEVGKAAEAAPGPTAPPLKQIEYQGSNKFVNQPDLFGDQPEQGSFRFMSESVPPWNDLTKPDTVANTPPGGIYRSPATGQMQKAASRFDVFGDTGNQYELGFTKPPADVNPNTGVFRGPGGKFQKSTLAYKQGELPLGEPEHQGTLDLIQPPRPVSGTPEAKVQELRTTLADAVKATEGMKAPQAEQVLSAVGKIDQSAGIGALKRLVDPVSGQGPEEIAREVPTFANPGGFLEDSKVISRARAQELTPHLAQQGEKLIDDFVNTARVARLPETALLVARREAGLALDKEYGRRFNDALLDMRYIPAEMHPGNTDTLVARIGKPDMTLFETPEKAQMFAKDVYKLGDKEYYVQQHGYGYSIEIPRTFDETTPAVRDALLTTANKTNTGPVNLLLNRLRSAEDILGNFQRGNRQIAVHTEQQIKASLKNYIDENLLIDKKSRRMVEDILRENRDMPNPHRPNERGAWYDTAGQFEQAFADRHGRLPTEKEVLAYDAYKRLSDFDWVARNMSVYRDKARMGVQTFRYKTPEGWTSWFEGKPLDKMPWALGKSDQDAGVWVHSNGVGKFYYKYNMDAETRKMIDDLIENRGHSVVQIFDPKKHPLAGIAKTAAGEDLQDQVNYVITNGWDKAPLSWNQVSYRPGVHSIYMHNWYVAQPQIQMGRGGKATFLGDNNILNVSTQAEAKMWSQRIDTARQLMKAGRTDELNQYIDRQLPHTRDQFYDLFRRADSPLNMDHPVTYKEAGQNTISTDARLKAEYDNGNLIDSTRNVHDLSNSMDKAFLQDRDNVINTVNERGGVPRLAPAEQFDPYIALNKAMNQGLRNVWMNDYKISAVESWIKEFEHVMKPGENSLMAHPLYFLHDPQWKTVSAAARGDLSAAKAAQRAIVNFIGTKTELGSALDTFKMHALNSVYNLMGQGKMLDMALATTKDPVHFMRGVAFHTKLGFFNPVQFFTQAQTMAHSIALSPQHGIAGFSAAPMIRWLGHNPEMLDTVAKLSNKFGWKESQFKEMYQTLQKTGLYEVAGEASLRDDAFDPPLFRGKFGHFLDAGAMFFNEGERMVRMTAFATSFREWRAANPTRMIGNREIGDIMRRADDMSLNMTRASNAAWQSGVMSVPTQFYAWNARMMEQLLGGRLTGAEKLRILALYSGLYGIPMGVGAGVGAVWPVYDSIKQEAIKRGINLDEGWTKAMTEGLMNQAFSWITGKDYNFAQRYAPGNNTAIRDMLNGDKGFLDSVFGASGTILGDIFQGLYPFLHNAAGIAQSNGDYPLMPSDFIKVLRNISTVDIGAKILGIVNYGKWYTKSGTEVEDGLNGVDAAMTVLGLSPLSVANTFLIQHALRDAKKNQDGYIKQSMEDYRRGIQAAQENDWTAAKDYWTRAETGLDLADLNTTDRRRAFHQMIQQNRTLGDKVRWDMLQHAPSSKFQQFFENFQQGKDR